MPKPKKAGRRKPKLVTGIFDAHTKGFGFVCPQDEQAPDIFIPSDYTNGALHKDTVECVLFSKHENRRKLNDRKPSRTEARVSRIIKRGLAEIAGTFCADEKVIVSSEPRVPYSFPVGNDVIKKNKLQDGHKLLFFVDLEGDVKVLQVYGHKDDPGMDVLDLIKQASVPYLFTKKALNAAARLPEIVLPEETAGREDFRALSIVTIDGADTKDIDDAIHLRLLPNGNFELGVHIADVSHYVSAASVLDREARERGTSIYLADRVIPMLPPAISNGICSLNPNVDRLALSCVMEIDPAGEVTAYRVTESIIHSRAQLTYEGVSEYLEASAGEIYRRRKKYACYEEYALKDMARLAGILREQRMARGSLDFDLPETVIRLDDLGQPIDIELRTRNAAMGIIEEFMLICNETIAKTYKNLVYRTHEKPDTDKIFTLAAYAHGLGYKLQVTERGVSNKALQKLLAAVKGKPEERALSTLTLRSLKQARYAPADTGHFGLGAKHYCHFTSPIRRYPDLMVHRAVKMALAGKRLKKPSEELCVHCSETERAAESLEREVDQLKKVKFMRDKVGQRFDAVISGVTGWGVFAQLENTIEGLVPIDSLDDDRYYFIEKQLAIFGERTKKKLEIGMPVKVELLAARVEERKLVFKIVW